MQTLRLSLRWQVIVISLLDTQVHIDSDIDWIVKVTAGADEGNVLRLPNN